MRIAFMVALISLWSCSNSDKPPKLASESLDSLGIEQLKSPASPFTQEEAENARNQQKKDSIRLASLGVEVLEIDDQKHKCNLKTGRFLLSHYSDTADLNFAAEQLAHSLIWSVKKDPSCYYPVMSAAFIYISKKEYQDDVGPVTGATITPNGLDVQGINTYVWDRYKKLK